jgi:hypothetical protein
MLGEFIIIIIVLWTLSFISIFKPVIVLRFKDYFRIKGEVEYTDIAIHSVIFGGIVLFVVSIVLIYFFFTEFYV